MSTFFSTFPLINITSTWKLTLENIPVREVALHTYKFSHMGFQGSVEKTPSAMQKVQELWAQSLLEDPLEQGI